jgi:LysR substrate binding domain
VTLVRSGGGYTRHVVVGAPSYFANRPRPIEPADLMDHECIRARHASGALYRWEFERHSEATRIDVSGSLTLDEPDMMAQSSRAGIGLAYVGEWIVADDIATGRLVEVLSDWTPSYPGYCLYYPGRRHMAASLRAFVDLAQEPSTQGVDQPTYAHCMVFAFGPNPDYRLDSEQFRSALRTWRFQCGRVQLRQTERRGKSPCSI